MMHKQERERLMDVLATLDVATDPDMMAQIRESERQLARGEGAASVARQMAIAPTATAISCGALDLPPLGATPRTGR